MVGHALQAAHRNSLSAALRSRGLSPLEVEQEPILISKPLARWGVRGTKPQPPALTSAGAEATSLWL